MPAGRNAEADRLLVLMTAPIGTVVGHELVGIVGKTTH